MGGSWNLEERGLEECLILWEFSSPVPSFDLCCSQGTVTFVVFMQFFFQMYFEVNVSECTNSYRSYMSPVLCTGLTARRFRALLQGMTPAAVRDRIAVVYSRPRPLLVDLTVQ